MKIDLSEGQAEKLVRGVRKNRDTNIKLSHEQLTGDYPIVISAESQKKLVRAKKAGVGYVVKIDAEWNKFWVADLEGGGEEDNGMFDEEDNTDTAMNAIDAAALSNPYTAAAMQNPQIRAALKGKVGEVVGNATATANELVNDVLGKETAEAVGKVTGAVGRANKLVDLGKNILADPTGAAMEMMSDPVGNAKAIANEVSGAASDIADAGKSTVKAAKSAGKKVGKTAKKAYKETKKAVKKVTKKIKKFFGFGEGSVEEAGLEYLVGNGLVTDELIKMKDVAPASFNAILAEVGKSILGTGSGFSGGDRHSVAPKILGTGSAFSGGDRHAKRGQGAGFSNSDRSGDAMEVGVVTPVKKRGSRQ